MAIPQELADILTGKNTNLRLQVVTDESGRQMVTAVNGDGEAKGDMMPLDQFVGQGMPNPYGGTSPASTITYNEQTGEFGDSQNQDVTQFLSTNYPGMGLVHQNLGTDRFIDPSKVYDTPYGRVTAQDNVRAGETSMLEGMINPVSLFALAMGIPTLPGGGTGFSSLLNTITGAPAAAMPGSALLDPSLITSPVAPVSTGSAFGTVDPFLQGVTQTMPTTLGASTVAGSTLGTAAPFTSGLASLTSPAAAAALEAWTSAAPLTPPVTPPVTPPTPPSTPTITPQQLATSAATTAATQLLNNGSTTPPPLDGEGGMVPGEYKDLGGTISQPGLGAAASLLNSLFKTSLTDADTNLIGKLLATGLGGIGASQQASASSDLAKQFMDLGKPYRDSLASLEANPASYYQSPEVQGALQQGSDALARSLSAKVGNPILNPTALQEMQNYSTNGLLGQLNQRRSFLANAGGLGVGQAAQLGSNATQASGGVYNALGAGLGTVFGNQKDYASELLDILKNRGGSSGMSLV